ncbi:MAG TPA: DUF6580 family putative transport protein [Nitrococcus sp.]|nr:DUF6580 family putative transport protein [Nitrococcus sp.]
MSRRTTLVLAGIMLATMAARLLPHPPNFTPVEAVALFGGTYVADRRLAFLLPLLALLLSDLVLGFAVYGYGLVYGGMAFVYASVALITALGRWQLRRRASVSRVATCALMAASLFFVVTNFGVWLTSGLYPHNASGLLACYVAGLPFFHYALAGALGYTVLLFGGLALARRHARTRQLQSSLMA